MKSDKFLKLFFTIFALVGIGMLIGGVVLFINSRNFKENAVPVSGIISRIDLSRDSDGDTNYRVFVTYDFDGTTYKDIPLNEYSSSMYEGKDIELYCDPQKPTKVSTPLGFLIGSLVLLIMGLVFSLIGIVPGIIILVRKKQAANIQTKGKRIYGVVDSIDYVTNVSMNGRNPLVVYCSYTDEFSGVTYRFKSENLWTDPYPVLQPQSTIEIFVMPDDYSKYYVNVAGALAGKIYDYT